MYAGIKVKIGEEEYTIPPISLGQLRNGLLGKLKEHDALSNDGKVLETMELRGEIILAAIRRNYPDFDEDKLFDYLDLASTGPIWLSILGLSGFNSGEVKAVMPGTSSPSTEASPPPTDGPIAK